MLKPQDILIVTKLLVMPKDRKWTYEEVATSIGLSKSEVYEGYKRAEACHLVDSLLNRPIKKNLFQFFESGLRYVYPAVVGKTAKGMPTAHSGPLLSKIFSVTEENRYVWLTPKGKSKGQTIVPLYRSVPFACENDPKLYEIMSVLDTVRVGGARERAEALKLLTDLVKFA